ncbi:MAG: threonylcarbamoyl-AMP synthase [Verrucomicrobia bacterium]|nr:threonylcarbamoyl-AMP synthase [Verrucomicrobiota bacterium]
MHHQARILTTDSGPAFHAALLEAARLLRRGELVAVPTETVYGLAANAWDARAAERIFAVKGRPAHNPLIVHVAGLDLARQCVRQWPRRADQLAAAFWPGPLTLVLPRSPRIPDAVTGGGDTVGVRWPSHPFIQALIRECGFPLAAPSANLSAGLSPTTAAHVQRSLGRSIPLVVDGGAAQVGIESSVLDLTVTPPRLLRPGVIHAESLRAVLGDAVLRPGGDETATPGTSLRSPGLLRRHYAPRARLVVGAWADDADLRQQIAARGWSPAGLHVLAHTRLPSSQTLGLGGVRIMPRDPHAFARALYAALHGCDEAGARIILAEAVPDAPEWRAIRDRLDRASAAE